MAKLFAVAAFDLDRFLAELVTLADEGARLEIGDGAVHEFVGNGDLALADPMQRLPTGVPQLLLHGDLDADAWSQAVAALDRL
jgi:hypothetical protein